LGAAIESVIDHCHERLQIIVVDDGSTDDTMSVATKYGDVVYIKQDNRGISAARNTGLRLVSGEFLAFLDADDLWCPFKLEKQIECFDREPEIDMVFGLVDEFHTPDQPPSNAQPRLAFPGYLPGTILIKTESFIRVGNFSTSVRTGEFIDWLLRAKEASLSSRMVGEVLLLRRLHANNSTRDKNSDRVDYAKVLKASLDRRRVKSVVD
jgi:glycosyltransferase involved in cell wall biosynthesis